MEHLGPMTIGQKILITSVPRVLEQDLYNVCKFLTETGL